MLWAAPRGLHGLRCEESLTSEKHPIDQKMLFWLGKIYFLFLLGENAN